jgi:hypothetical protein
MPQMQSEDDLVQRIKTDFYQVFRLRDLQAKRIREKAAWNLLRTNRGNYTQQNLNQILDKGIATLLLYLQNPTEYSVWLPTTHRSLEQLGRIQGLAKSNWSKNYPIFNAAAISFRDRHGFEPQEVDWALWMIDLIAQDSPALDRYRQ